jgi:hypothetical protein
MGGPVIEGGGGGVRGQACILEARFQIDLAAATGEGWMCGSQR